MVAHKWLAPRTFMELKRAYASGMSYKAMAHTFELTINQISWYLRDVPKQRTKRMPTNKPKRRQISEAVMDAKALATIHAQAKRALKKEVEDAVKERNIAPLYRPSLDKIWS
jgi:hypothetical protein